MGVKVLLVGFSLLTFFEILGVVLFHRGEAENFAFLRGVLLKPGLFVAIFVVGIGLIDCHH